MKIKLGGEEFELKSLTLNDWCKLEEQGIDLDKFNKGVTPSMKDIRALAYVAISKVSDKTLEWVGDNIDPMKDAEIFKDIIDFISAKESPATKNT